MCMCVYVYAHEGVCDFCFGGIRANTREGGRCGTNISSEPWLKLETHVMHYKHTITCQRADSGNSTRYESGNAVFLLFKHILIHIQMTYLTNQQQSLYGNQLVKVSARREKRTSWAESHYKSQRGFSPKSSTGRSQYSSQITPRSTEPACCSETECYFSLHSTCSRDL